MDFNRIESDMEVSKLIEDYEKKIYDLMQLIEIGKGLNSTLIDYNRLIDSILLACMGQMQLIKAGIFLKKDVAHDAFVLHRNYKGFELDHSIEYEIEEDSSFIYFLENNFRCYTMEELNEIFQGNPVIDTMKEVAPCLVVPLKGKDKLNGIIVLGERINDEVFSMTEKNYLMHVSSLAGVAIQNAHLYEMATTDMMTKLKLHHFFQASLIEEREKSLKHKFPLSVIMIDIDHFKVFNDTYGHISGDIALKNVAVLIMDKVRQLDIASRYGGEEFAIILPETDIEEAYAVAERIRQSVEKSILHYEEKTMTVTISIGVTQYFSYRDKDNQSLIDRADKALYVSKESGRNRTTVLR